ncbi:hypothetical protein BX600DRAFT_429009 [Xylariales sp. PMI_506]|nr:hypothetical protein BX600DRAFT_429009 [Xylariales sp. PMI_506]
MKPSIIGSALLASVPLTFAQPDQGGGRPSFPLLLRAGTYARSNSSRPKAGSAQYGSVITGCTVPDRVALTFDDGPGPYTKDLLALLDSHGARATFFVNGNNMMGPIIDPSSEAAAVLKETHAGGHQIGSHTWSHADLGSLSTAQRVEEMEKLEEALTSIIGVSPTYMRPPYLSCADDCVSDLADMGYHVVECNLDTRDWAGDYDSAHEIYSSALSSPSTQDAGYIVLSHDVKEQTVYSLAEYMITTAKQLGYKLVTVGECLGDSRDNWYRSGSN